MKLPGYKAFDFKRIAEELGFNETEEVESSPSVGSWMDYLNDKERMILGNVEGQEWFNKGTQNLLRWFIEINNTLSEVLPLDPAEEHTGIIRWWDKAKRDGILKASEHNKLMEIAIENLYF